MNKKFLATTTVLVVICALTIITITQPGLDEPQNRQEALDFTVTGSNGCLRFLDRNVQTAYIPFRTGANEQWNLTIACTQMPGAAGWTEVYLYKGYWDNGSNHVCVSEDLYPIISQIETTEFQIKTNSTFTQTFGETTPQSYTLFFLMPPSGNGTYHINLQQIH